jgi:hypothetical protein
MNGTARDRAGRLEKRAVMVVLRDAAAGAVMAEVGAEHRSA